MNASTGNVSLVSVTLALLIGGVSGWTLHSLRPLKLSETELLAHIRQHQLKERSLGNEASRKNRAIGREFLAENANRPGTRTLANGLQYKIFKAGQGQMVKVSDQIKVSLKELPLDEAYSSLQTTQMRDTVLDVSKTIPGLQAGLTLMKEGEIFRFFIPPDLAFGEENRPGIAPASTLVYDVEIKKINTL